MKKITFDEKGTPHIKIDDAVTEAFQTDKAMKDTMKDRVNVREFGPCIEFATADGGDAPALKDASMDDILGEISARMEDKDETIAFLNKRVNEFVKSNARLTEEKQRLKAADAERKRLLVRKAALEEEVSKLRGQLSQETKKRKEAEEAARDATELHKQSLEKIDDLQREVCLLYGQMADMAEAEQASSALDKDEIIRELADRIMEWAEGHTDADGRSKMKSMITDVFRNNLTEEQWERHADLDLRDTKKATQVNVWGGGVYNAHVERQALDAPVKRTRRNGEQGWLINR